MELDNLLDAMDRTSANLAKLEEVWTRAATFIPTGPARGSDPEYDDLRRAWQDLLVGLPPIDSWTITEQLPDIDELGQAFIDYFEISEAPFSLYEVGERPGRDLAEYRYRLNRCRRKSVRERLQQLITGVDTALERLLDGAPRSSQELQGPDVDEIASSIREIERLLGDTAQRRGRWGDLHRHLHFGQANDWHDIRESDWPSVRSDVTAGTLSDPDPLSVPDIDLGHASASHPTGAATIALSWNTLDDDGFERLLYDLLRQFPEHLNVQWLMQTRAPDRGRDLSMDRILPDGTGGVRSERVIVQAKHWLSHSVAPTDIANTLAAVKLWQPPVVRGLVIATSGRFSADAVSWAEQHNESGSAPFIELWAESKLETLLAQKSHLAVAHGLR